VPDKNIQIHSTYGIINQCIFHPNHIEDVNHDHIERCDQCGNTIYFEILMDGGIVQHCPVCGLMYRYQQRYWRPINNHVRT